MQIGGLSLESKNRMANSEDPDGTARYEPSHLDLHCLHRYLFWSAGLKVLNSKKIYFSVDIFLYLQNTIFFVKKHIKGTFLNILYFSFRLVSSMLSEMSCLISNAFENHPLVLPFLP